METDAYIKIEWIKSTLIHYNERLLPEGEKESKVLMEEIGFLSIDTLTNEETKEFVRKCALIMLNYSNCSKTELIARMILEIN